MGYCYFKANLIIEIWHENIISVDLMVYLNFHEIYTSRRPIGRPLGGQVCVIFPHFHM